jgi:hypothetical protein
MGKCECCGCPQSVGHADDCYYYGLNIPFHETCASDPGDEEEEDPLHQEAKT